MKRGENSFFEKNRFLNWTLSLDFTFRLKFEINIPFVFVRFNDRYKDQKSLIR